MSGIKTVRVRVVGLIFLLPSNTVSTARTWFGFVSVWTCALAAAKAKSLDAMAMAKALQGF
jgi:hypothetical protein